MASPLPTHVGPSEPLLESAARLGQLAWLERRLFEVLGAWVPTTAVVPVKLAFADLAPRAAWRARVWHDRLPELREFPREPFVLAPSPQVAAALDDVARLDGSLDRLAALGRAVLPALLAAYDDQVERSTPVADGPFLGWVVPARASLVEDHDRVEHLLSDRVALAADAEEVEAAVRLATADLQVSFKRT